MMSSTNSSLLLVALLCLLFGQTKAFSSSTPSVTTATINSPNFNTPSNEQVIEAAETVMAHTGYFNAIDESLFADDFIFRGQVIGPLNKKDYKEVLEYFSIYKAFPDMETNCFGYTVDPEDPYRVWVFLRATGTYTNPLGGPILGKLLPPDGQHYRGSPETWSLTFDETLKCRLMTAGYVSDRLDEKATTNGVGLAFGILETLGLSSPSGVGDPRLRLIQAVGGPLAAVGLAPKSVSNAEEVPSWWTNSKRGADP